MQSSNVKTFLATALIFAIVNASHGFKRIVGGTTTTIEAFPYTVVIETLLEGIYILHTCGGSLIRPDWVISAAHCFKKGQEYFVTAGASYVNRDEGERRKVEQIYELDIDFDYLRIDSKGDIVLIRLEKPLPINKKIQTIELPPPSTGSVPQEMATVSGWGYSKFNDGQLRYANLPIRDDYYCNNHFNPKIAEDAFCAGYPDKAKGACAGDSGGPLVLNGVLYGVVSMGGRFCETYNSLNIFVKVPYYVEKIQNIIDNTP